MSGVAKSKTGSRFATLRPPSWKSWKSSGRHISCTDWPIWTKFGTLMQNDTLMTIKASKSKPEIKFQYGGRLFSETGSSNILAVNWDNSLKFGARIDFNVLRWVPLPNPKPEVDLRRHSRHLENRYAVITPSKTVRFGRNLVCWCRKTCRWWR